MTKQIRDPRGRFVDNIGDGKDKVPTPPNVPPPRAYVRDEEDGPQGYDLSHKRFQALTPEKDSVDAAAAQVHRTVSVTPNSLPKRKRKANPGAPARTPGGWLLTAHIQNQARAKGILIEDVEECVDDPHTVYPSLRFPGQERRIRGDLCVVVDPERSVAVTVYANRVETDLRDDQRSDPDALAYDRKRRSKPGR